MSGIKIALVGKIRSGKDTAAAYLISEYGFKRFAFGDGIRNICSILFPEAIKGGKPRYLYQGVGQDMRQYDENVWIKYVLRQLSSINPSQNIVITDVRQPNEYETLKDLGYFIVKIHVPDDVRLARMRASGDKFKIEDLNHDTESHIDSFNTDYQLTNNGSFKDLFSQIDRMMADINKRNKGGMTFWERLKLIYRQKQNAC